ncbi:MAG TPA: PEP-CTERM sorting domain-containing protein [Verrucomicrobiae bacterium]|jgi:hypothetical protein|nr:PEP-CTERM sorting domain-containing protein [Verrucomicrobiae bacterium]
MNKKTIILAVAGAALVAGSQAQAQVAYNNEDLLLDFRNTAATSDADVTVDLGQVSTFASQAASSTVQLNVGAGAQFTQSELLSAFGGSLASVGFTAAAGDNVSDTTWITRVVATPSLNAPTPVSAQPTLANAITTVNQIGQVGVGAALGTGVTAFGSANGSIVASGNAESYQNEATPSGEPANLNFRGLNTAGGAGGPLENITTGANIVYSALWEVPHSGQSLSDEYLGYFTFNGATGEIDFTAVPEPSTYGVLAASGLLALALRRQYRALNA